MARRSSAGKEGKVIVIVGGLSDTRFELAGEELFSSVASMEPPDGKEESWSFDDDDDDGGGGATALCTVCGDTTCSDDPPGKSLSSLASLSKADRRRPTMPKDTRLRSLKEEVVDQSAE